MDSPLRLDVSFAAVDVTSSLPADARLQTASRAAAIIGVVGFGLTTAYLLRSGTPLADIERILIISGSFVAVMILVTAVRELFPRRH